MTDKIETEGGKKQRAEAKRNALRRLLHTAILGGGAYGSYRLGNWFLPEESRKAISATGDVLNKLQTSRALSGRSDALDNRTIGAYAEHASRLANSPIAGVKGKDFVKFVRTSLPVKNAWRPFWSDAHYDSFARGPAFGAAQLIDEHAADMADKGNGSKPLLKYLSEKFTHDFGGKVNDIAEYETGGPLFDEKTGLREGLAYGENVIGEDKQKNILSRILTDSELDQPSRNMFGFKTKDGLGSASKAVKRDLSDALLDSSFPNYIRLGGYANKVRGALSGVAPILLGTAAAGTAGLALLSALKATKRTKAEEARLKKLKEEEELAKNSNEQTENNINLHDATGLLQELTHDGARITRGRLSHILKTISTAVKAITRADTAVHKIDDHNKEANVEELKRAKAMSDKKRYSVKNSILIKLIKENPDDFVVDQEDPKYPGITHKPSGFKIHTSRHTAALIPKQAGILATLSHARKATNTAPTEKQKESGNYVKGKFKFHDITIAIENPKGSIRSGVSKAGKKWSNKMKADYGYFVGTKAIDGDAVDVFIGPDASSEFVAAIDQEIDGSFDETKFVIGCRNKQEASDLYLSHYEKGWNLGAVASCTVAQLKHWLKNGDTKKPFNGQMVKAAGWSKTVGKMLAAGSLKPEALQRHMTRAFTNAGGSPERSYVFDRIGKQTTFGNKHLRDWLDIARQGPELGFALDLPKHQGAEEVAKYFKGSLRNEISRPIPTTAQGQRAMNNLIEPIAPQGLLFQRPVSSSAKFTPHVADPNLTRAHGLTVDEIAAGQRVSQDVPRWTNPHSRTKAIDDSPIYETVENLRTALPKSLRSQKDPVSLMREMDRLGWKAYLPSHSLPSRVARVPVGSMPTAMEGSIYKGISLKDEMGDDSIAHLAKAKGSAPSWWSGRPDVSSTYTAAWDSQMVPNWTPVKTPTMARAAFGDLFGMAPPRKTRSRNYLLNQTGATDVNGINKNVREFNQAENKASPFADHEYRLPYVPYDMSKYSHLIDERMRRMRDRRGECYTCAKPNRDGLVCDCGETLPWSIPAED